jgi:hypothetical protein
MTSGLWLAVLVTVSLVTTTGVLTVLVQAGAIPVHNGSPPPPTVTLLMLGLAAVAATFTGTVNTMLPIPAPNGIEQPAKVLPLLGQPPNVTAVLVVAAATVGAPLRVIPAGKMSASVMGCAVALPATAMVMV